MTSAFKLKHCGRENILKFKYYCSLNMDRERGGDRQTDRRRIYNTGNNNMYMYYHSSEYFFLCKIVNINRNK